MYVYIIYICTYIHILRSLVNTSGILHIGKVKTESDDKQWNCVDQSAYVSKFFIWGMNMHSIAVQFWCEVKATEILMQVLINDVSIMSIAG